MTPLGRFEMFPWLTARYPPGTPLPFAALVAAHQLSSGELTVSGHGPDASEVVPQASTGTRQRAVVGRHRGASRPNRGEKLV
jgi:hypothetical protein